MAQLEIPGDDAVVLLNELRSFELNPVDFVRWAYPWGEPGTPLANEDGPNSFQMGVLQDTQDMLREDPHMPIRLATTSGHGVGKSALVSWLVDWTHSTKVDCKGVVTANTETQLKTKTWAEVAKWNRMSLSEPLFQMTKTARLPRLAAHEQTWRIDQVPWSERNTEAFAGLHNQDNRVVLLFDEASAIPDIIFEVAEGALTDESTQVLWYIFGNPTRNVGRFRECFDTGKFANRWRSRQVDSRSVPQTNKRQLDEWIEDYGEDSDFVRIRVLGRFPRTDGDSFISYETAIEATSRHVFVSPEEPVVIGVDVARGDGLSCIYPRQGRDGRSRPPVLLQTDSLMTLVEAVNIEARKYNAMWIFVDGTGVGGGVIDMLRRLGYQVVDVQFGAKPDGGSVQESYNIAYFNKRAEIWGSMKDWLETGAIPAIIRGEEVSLVDQLVAPKYQVREDARGSIQLERKVDVKKRLGISPDSADALACTFAYAGLTAVESMHWGNEVDTGVLAADYDPYERYLNEATHADMAQRDLRARQRERWREGRNPHR